MYLSGRHKNVTSDFSETLGRVQTRLSALNSSLKMLPMLWTAPALQHPHLDCPTQVLQETKDILQVLESFPGL